jgi:prepilin-type N-terminal cleavage/methylation domain-containing protein
MSNKFSRGFTIIELIVAMTVMTILSGVVFVALDGLYSGNVGTSAQSTLDTDTLSVLRSIEKELTDASGWTTSLPVSIPLGPTNNTITAETWSYCGTGGVANCTQSVNRVLIASTPATDKADSDSTRLPIFANTSGSCNTAGTINTVQAVRIYFVAPDHTDATKNDLYRRTILNPTGATICGSTNPYQTTTCAPSVSNYAACKDTSGVSHTDAILATNISSFSVDYYTNANDSSPISSEYTTTASTINSSQAVRLTLGTNVFVNGATTTDTASIVISL